MRIRVYLKTFDASGNLETTFRDITDDVLLNNIGSISERLDNSEYVSGTYRVSDMNLTVQNRGGLYSEAGNVNSLFLYSRTNSIIKITVQESIQDNICGFAICGGFTCGDSETTVFEGILSDEATQESVEKQNISFRVLGYQVLLERSLAPTVTNGQSFSTVITNCLTTAGLTVGSVSVGNNQTIDDATDLVGTCKDVIGKILEASDSVLITVGDIAYVENREQDKTSSKTFYGQASTTGSEDIIGISSASNGLSRTFNYIMWQDTALFDQNATSVNKNGVRKKEVAYSFITNTTKRNSILASLVSTLGNPKKEFALTVPLWTENLSLNVLDVINIDYPTPLFAVVGSSLPIYGIATYGTDKYPYGDFSISINSVEKWKIISRQLDLKNGKITYGVRNI